MQIQFVGWGLLAFQLIWFVLVLFIGAWFGYCAFRAQHRDEQLQFAPLALMSCVSSFVIIAFAMHLFWPPALGLVLATTGGYFYARRHTAV